MLFIILTVLIFQLLGTQGSFDVHIEDVEVGTYSKEYFTEPEAYIDSTEAIVLNGSIIKKLPTTAQGHFALIGASMGEYVVDTGFDVTLDLCDIMNEPIMMSTLSAALGFHPDNCPPDIGAYGTDGYHLPMDTLPDDFPPNSYRVLLELLNEGQTLASVYVYASIH